MYDETKADATCSNCFRRKIPCGSKLPGPKAQVDAFALGSAQDRTSKEAKEYVRLFERFQQLRPDDADDEIAKLVELVENGTLKEDGDTFVVRSTEDDFEMDIFGVYS